MRKAEALAVGATVALLSVVAAPAMAAKQPTVDGERLKFRLPALDGERVGLNDDRFAGKVVLVELWGTWCPPCLTEIPTLVDLQTRYRDAGLRIVAIAFENEEEPAERTRRLREFVEERGINYLVLDGGTPETFEKALPSMRGVRGFPVEILIDRSGRVVTARNGYGYKKRWARKLEREIRELLAADGRGSPPTVSP